MDIQSILYEFEKVLIRDCTKQFLTGALTVDKVNLTKEFLLKCLEDQNQMLVIVKDKLRRDMEQKIENPETYSKEISYRLSFIYNTETLRSYNWGVAAACLFNRKEYFFDGNERLEIENSRTIQCYKECPPYHPNGKTILRPKS